MSNPSHKQMWIKRTNMSITVYEKTNYSFKFLHTLDQRGWEQFFNTQHSSLLQPYYRMYWRVKQRENKGFAQRLVSFIMSHYLLITCWNIHDWVMQDKPEVCNNKIYTTTSLNHKFLGPAMDPQQIDYGWPYSSILF